MTKPVSRSAAAILTLLMVACGESEIPVTPVAASTTLVEPDTTNANVDEQTLVPVQNTEGPGTFLLTNSERGLPPELTPLSKPWTGDFDGMVERRLVRVLTVHQLGGYFLDGPQEKGITYDLAKMFEGFLNERLGTGHVKLHVVLIPVEFDQLLDGLVQGYGDIAAAGLSITPERDEIIDFGAPLSREVKEIIVTGPAAPPLKTLQDLAGQEVFVKPGSSYRASLEELNVRLQAEDLEAIRIKDAPALLQDVDLLEMVSAGLLPMIAMDDYKARFWTEILEGLTAREDLVIRDGQRLAWAMRESSPLLKAEIDEFAQANRQGTLMGNILIKRYLKSKSWVNNALDPNDLSRFEETVELFRKYAGQYDFDHLMIAAQGYQESRLDQSVRSSAGAIGVMQLLKSTATDKNVNIPNIEQVEANIHAGVKYLSFIRLRYFDDPALDAFNSALFSFAAYNAGPARVRGLRSKAAEAGLDPNKWFNNVELIAAKEIGRETVQYVSNIYKYYLAYTLISDKQNGGN